MAEWALAATLASAVAAAFASASIGLEEEALGDDCREDRLWGTGEFLAEFIASVEGGFPGRVEAERARFGGPAEDARLRDRERGCQ